MSKFLKKGLNPMTPKTIRLIAPALIILLFTVCGGPTVNITRIEKAEIEMNGIDQIAVADFKDHHRAPGSGSLTASALISRLKGEGHYRVVERGQLEKVINEQKLGLAGVIDENTAAEVGKLVGVKVAPELVRVRNDVGDGEFKLAIVWSGAVGGGVSGDVDGRAPGTLGPGLGCSGIVD